MRRLGLIILLFILGTLLLAPSKVSALTKQINVELEYDTYIEESAPTLLHYWEPLLYVGNLYYQGKGKARAIVKPDYYQLKMAGIQPEQITKAKLYLYTVDWGTQDSIQINVYDILSSWNPSDLTWDTFNLPLKYVYFAHFNFQQGYPGITITSGFKRQYAEYLSGAVPGGFLLRSPHESTRGRYIAFFSQNCVYASYPLYCYDRQVPYITVWYTDTLPPATPSIIAPENNLVINHQEVNFQVTPVTDPEGDQVYYRFLMASDESFSETVFVTPWSDEPTATITLDEGHYYWRAEAKDTSNNVVQTPVYQLTVDLSAPSAPALNAPPYVTSKKQLVLSWNPLDENVSYQVEWSNNSGFVYSQRSEWINDTTFEFSFPAVGVYYFRVRAKDKVGNIGEWSDAVEVLYDPLAPKILEFSVEPTLVDTTERKTVKVKATIDELTFEEAKVILVDSEGNETVLRTYTEPDISGRVYVNRFTDGSYYIFLRVYDKSGQYAESEKIPFIIDTVAPVISIKNEVPIDKPLKSDPRWIVSCSEDGQFILRRGRVRLLQMRVKAGEWFTVAPKLNEGKNTLTFSCYDTLGHRTDKKQTVLIDRTAPKISEIKVVNEKNVSYLRLKCEKSSLVFVDFGFGNPIKKVCDKQSLRFVVPSNLVPGKYYLFKIWARDTAGNESKVQTVGFTKPNREENTSVNSFKDPKKAKPFSEIFCILRVRINQFKKRYQIAEKICDTQNISVDQVKPVITWGLIGYRIDINTPYYVQIKVIYEECSKLSWFLTLIGKDCIYQPVKESVTSARLILKGKLGRYYRTARMGMGTHKAMLWMGPYQETVNYKLFLEGFLISRLVNVPYLGQIFLEEKIYEQSYKLPLSEIVTKIKKPLDWIFFDYKGVYLTQRFGKTRFTSFHGGIDLSAHKKPIKVPAEGRIIRASYHRRNACFSGGYYIAIKHAPNLYTYYFHLLNLRVGKTVRAVGQKVRRGDTLAITGASGRYRCKPLKHHLHFEVRTCLYTRCRVNPLDYLNFDPLKLKYKL